MQPAEHHLNPEELMALLDGELPRDRAALVEAHVARCGECQRMSESLAQTSNSLARWSVEEPPETLQLPPPGEPVRQTFGMMPWRLSRRMVLGLSGAVGVVILVGASNYMRMASPSGRYVTASENIPAHLRGAPRIAGALEAPAAALSPLESSAQGQDSSATTPPVRVGGGSLPLPRPAIARTATLHVVAADFDAARQSLERIVAELQGNMGRITVAGASPNPRTLEAAVLVPADSLDGAMSSLRALGRVVHETRAGDDVTEQVVDLDARLANARSTEKRLVDLLQKRTGDLSDVLAAEREVARVREEIERFVAQRNNLQQRVSYATVTLSLTEEPKASLDLGSLSMTGRFRNALVSGSRVAFESVLECLLIVVRVAPVLAVWALILGVPLRFLANRSRNRRSTA